MTDQKIVPLHAFAPVQRLSGAARVALVAPSGPLTAVTDLEHAIENVHQFGWTPVVGDHVSACAGYLAGTDQQRLDDLNCALRDDTVDAIWCLRGGYGVTRILDGIAYDAVRRHPKPIIGYSDITALHAAIGRECEIVTYHGPTARSTITPFSRNSFERALVFGEDPCGTSHSARTIRTGTARGRLMGGNLALVTALIGTRYALDLRQAILVLEDVNEPIYRIDRMLRQLWMSGALANLAALAFGQCTSSEDDTTAAELSSTPPDHRRTLDDVLREVADGFNIPCVAGLPIGHVDDQWTLPLGSLATLDADTLTLTIDS
ncbi:MAG TPA: LD-carboxypeptidase [Gemmatimonadaceae bacterium]|nr:LD-carboxypeptidase [Gemmatimonadaceae bacterium]